MKYKVGKKVVLRDDLEEGVNYGGWPYYKKIGRPGSKVVITNIDTDRFCGSFYQIDGQPDSFVTDEMIDHNQVAELCAKNERAKEAKRHKDFWSMSGKESKDHKKKAELKKDNTLSHYLSELEGRVTAGYAGSDTIEPPHYNNGDIDLIESWYLTMPFEGFRWAMKSHVDKYVYRYEEKNGIEDLDKAIEFIERLKEKEEEHG